MARGGADWRTVIMDQVTVRAADVREKNPGASNVAHISRVGFSVDAHRFLVQAARTRHISIAGYIRRATLARVAYDLGLPARDLFALDVGIMPIGRSGPASKDLDGKLYGSWEVQSDEQHRSG
ncbi:ribbon-helix-helix DNA binding domain protein [Microbacterium phage Fregley]|nr:ribbon-helix-helix DNA binding domain protein [Microbacterium phage Fregley]